LDKKNQQSKAQYGTLTATQDANNDYSSKTPSAAGGSSSGATSSVSEMANSTLTAKYDANNDYDTQKDTASQASGKSAQTSSKNNRK